MSRNHWQVTGAGRTVEPWRQGPGQPSTRTEGLSAPVRPVLPATPIPALWGSPPSGSSGDARQALGLGPEAGGPVKGIGGSDGGWHLGIPSEGGSVLLVEASLLTLKVVVWKVKFG